jgi:hypothetical protein
MPELRRDERLQLKWPRAGIETGLALFVFLQTLVALVRSDRLEVLLWWTRETWLLLTLLWAKNLVLAALAAAVAVAAFRWLEGTRGAAPPAARTRALVWSAASALVLGAALRWVWPSILPPAQFSDTFSELEHVLRDPLGAPWIGMTPFPAATHDQISNLYARIAHASLVAFGGGAEGLLSVAAVPGTLLLPALLWLGLEVGGPAVGVIALWFVACGAWPLNVARWGFTGSAMLPLLTAGLAALLAGRRTGRTAWGLLAGACLGFSLHTHPGAWATVGALALWGVVRFVSVAADRRLIAATALAGALALAPFAWGFVREPSRLGGHLRDVHLQKPVRDVSAPSGAGAAGLTRRLAYNALSYTALFTGAADPNVRHGMASHARLPLLMGLAALLGAAAAFRPGAPAGERALLVFAGGSFLAGILSDPGGAPNSFRVCALVSPLFVWAAMSLRAASVRVGALVRAGPGLVAALAVAAVFATDTVPFLARWPFEPGVEASFSVGESEAGRLLDLVGARSVTLDPGVVRHPIVIETVARRVSFRAPVPAWPERAPEDMAGTGAGWYVSDARRLERLCALRRCGHPVRLNQYGPEVDLVRLGP